LSRGEWDGYTPVLGMHVFEGGANCLTESVYCRVAPTIWVADGALGKMGGFGFGHIAVS